MGSALEHATLNYWVSCHALRRSLERGDNGTAYWYRQKLLLLAQSDTHRLAGAADRGLKIIAAAHAAQVVCHLSEYRQ